MRIFNIDKIIDDIKNVQLRESSGHDWWHTLRVYNNAVDIARNYYSCKIDMDIIELGALMHDFADHKFGYTDSDRERIIHDFLFERNVPEEIINEVIYISNNISFDGGSNKLELKNIESKIVQDADRLDAIGAIGVARAFAYGGYSKRCIYSPDSNNDGDTIQHFYEKLLLLKDKMNTEYGRLKAEERHIFMEQYLVEFYKEWNGEK